MISHWRTLGDCRPVHHQTSAAVHNYWLVNPTSGLQRGYKPVQGWRSIDWMRTLLVPTDEAGGVGEKGRLSWCKIIYFNSQHRKLGVEEN